MPNLIEDLLLVAFREVKAVELGTRTDPLMRKTDNPYFGRVEKVSRIRALVGPWNYTHEVNVKRIKEGKFADFSPAGRKWGHRVAGTPFVEYRGDKYVECNVLEVISTEFLVDGRLATDGEVTEIQGFIPGREEGARQGLDDPIVVRDYKVESIEQVEEVALSFSAPVSMSDL